MQFIKNSDSIRLILSQNTYVNYLFYRAIGFPHAKRIKEIITMTSKMDTIEDISELSSFLRMIKKMNPHSYETMDLNEFFFRDIYALGLTLYGTLENCSALTPSTEHGLFFHPDVGRDTRFTARASCSTFSEFRREIIHKYDKRPVFCVGPYIAYADGYWSEVRLAQEKKKMGRTLVVFPSHSHNRADIDRKGITYIQQIRQLAGAFDTVLVNVYFWDLDDPMVSALAAEGYRIVSAGFRGGTAFLQRLKTILQLADMVATDSLGTHVGYGVCLKVPCIYFETSIHATDKCNNVSKYTEFTKPILENFKTIFSNADSISPQMWEFCNKYWGLDQIKTQEEIKAIYEINVEITRRAKGFVAAFPATAQKLLDKYETENDLKYRLLKAALPKSDTIKL